MKGKGKISINTENIFPIIKKFLYSDQDIFLRELISNAVDATQKLKRLSSLGEYKDEIKDPLKKKVYSKIGELFYLICPYLRQFQLHHN